MNTRTIRSLMKKYFELSDAYSIKDGVVYVDGGCFVRRTAKTLTEIPVKFGTVTHTFQFDECQLTSLNNAPYKCKFLDCKDNKLTSFEGLSSDFEGNLDIRNNPLTSLDYLPLKIIRVLDIPYSKTLPMLKLVQLRSDVKIYIEADDREDEKCNEIIMKYVGVTPVRKAILLCQKELIDAGFNGNAKL